MVNIEINVNPKESALVRERNIFALGWVRFKSSSANNPEGDEMRVLGVMLVQDKPGECPSTSENES